MPQFHPDNSRTLEQWADEIHTTIGEIMPEVKTKEEYAESFLSGGVDSSYVLAISDVETTDSCGYDEERFDESGLANRRLIFWEEKIFDAGSLRRNISLLSRM